MIIYFKAIIKGQPSIVGSGDKKYYPSPVMEGEMNIDALTKSIEKICRVSNYCEK